MMNQINTLISSEAEKSFPFFKEKLIFDFVNGLQVSEELNATKKQRSSLWARFLDGLSGADRMRQDHLNDHFTAGLKACQHLILELSQDITSNAIALNEINKSLQKTQRNVAHLANYVADFRDEFLCFAEQTNKELKDLQQYLNLTSRSLLAERQINRSFNQWGAGGFDHLHPLGRCYAVVDALYWGAFGQQMLDKRDQQELLADLKNRLIIQLKEDFNISNIRENIPQKEWLKIPTINNNKIQKETLEILQFQGDWSWQSPQLFATTFVATQQMHSSQEKPLVSFPVIVDIHRVANRIVDDSFSELRIK